MIVVIGHSSGHIGHTEGTAHDERTVGAVLPVQSGADAQHRHAHRIAQDSACHLVDPVVVDGILDKESDADDEHDNTNLAKQILANKLLEVAAFVDHRILNFLVRNLLWFNLCFCNGRSYFLWLPLFKWRRSGHGCRLYSLNHRFGLDRRHHCCLGHWGDWGGVEHHVCLSSLSIG